MKIVIDREQCMGDGICFDICPEGALEMLEGYPVVVKMENCTECEACVVACEYDALNVEEGY